jgi:aminomethyltransferase
VDTSLCRTPLYDLILAQGGRLVDFAGWAMPVQFTGLKQEHQAVREAAGMFDISHMGKFQLRGESVLAGLDQLVPSDLSKLQPGQAQYTVLLTPEGGTIDDLIIYSQGEVDGAEQVTVIVNAATTDKDKAWLTDHLPTGISLHDLSRGQILLAIQGPKALEALQPLASFELVRLNRFGHTVGTLFDQQAFIARTGYTGEDGVEVMLPLKAGRQLWSALLEQGVVPCGLGARDTLRLESAMALYGQDIDEQTSPLEAGLGWLVHWDKTKDFLGREALTQQKLEGVTRRLVGLEMEGRNIARPGYPVLSEGGPVGVVTSGTWSPTLERAIALAYVTTEQAKLGSVLGVEIRGKLCSGRVVKKPFYKRS